MSELNKQPIRDAIAEMELACTELEEALTMGYSSSFKTKIDNAQYFSNKASKRISDFITGS